MTSRGYFKVAFALSFGGTLFAGYLSGVKLLTGTCAFNESCPYFLGYPSCWYGFGMFLAMTLVAAAALLKRVDGRKAARAMLWVALAGTLFAGWFVVQEVVDRLVTPSGMRYGLVLPTCVYGLVFYVLLLCLSLSRVRKGEAA